MTTLVLNPIVQELFDVAVKAAQPFWVGIMENGVELCPRQQCLFEPGGQAKLYFNVTSLKFGPSDRITIVHELGLAETSTGPWINSGIVSSNGVPYPIMHNGDTLEIRPGHITVTGNMHR